MFYFHHFFVQVLIVSKILQPCGSLRGVIFTRNVDSKCWCSFIRQELLRVNLHLVCNLVNEVDHWVLRISLGQL